MKKLIALFVLTMFSFTLPAMAAKYKVVDITDGGSVSGKVGFSGTDTPPKVYTITKDQEVCGTGNREIDFIKVNNGALQNVVVYLVSTKGKPIKAGKAFPKQDLKINQEGCEFHPFLGVTHMGSTLSALNSDPVSHNIHTYEYWYYNKGRKEGQRKGKKGLLNTAQPKKGHVIKREMGKKKMKFRKGTVMKIECDQHDFMHGFVFVAKSPYYAVVDTEGNFTIDNIPAGDYIARAWHGTLGEQSVKVSVSGGGSADANFNFK